MGRITGPEPEAERMRATALNLILATPTVDIGYNFDKKDKQRQNVDFLICDARYGDELLQRIGRAGRVLGKQETTIPAAHWRFCRQKRPKHWLLTMDKQ